jgi:hypothetical protein
MTLAASLTAIVTSYEILRRVALGHSGPHDGPSLGFTLLRRHGMTAWLHAWATCPRPATPAAAPTVSSVAVPSVIHREMAQVWAQMVRRHQEVTWS